ncbi:tryptophan halogenase family protein [Alteromonas sp. a30]|uniref:tryptophan halogenase family protein n=1 Tax=Alteromonas sp. a30 TaxID=2730917 RepID=UPI002280A626|nr:tryptophan halogenase family protein [Alteromonas sp. a30]MCY7294046.1 tryptophan 7-halogenase [Alteromonas sp. a30]
MSNQQHATQVVVVGGGTAGWLTACLLRACPRLNIHVTLVESPNIPSIGVGEGTWPSMRQTLHKIGLSEAEFLKQCDAAFKQGSRFDAWRTGQENDRYYHPFTLPEGYPHLDLSQYWLPYQQEVSFANAVSAQARVSDMQRAPKALQAGENSTALNYGYHLDAGKFASLLQTHGTAKLGVNHVLATIDSVIGDSSAPIQAIVTDSGERFEADLFIDCTGFSGRLIEQHYHIPWQSIESTQINNRALALQIPYENAHSPIASATLSTAHSQGWTWDIGLQNRRGIGLVYSSHFTSDDEAEQCLRQHVENSTQGSGAFLKQLEKIEAKAIAYQPGVRTQFWHHNCVAIGLSAGFLEPLEASAIALIESAVNFISDNITPDVQANAVVAKRFNSTMHYHWSKIIDFIKLHYVLSSRRDSDYWRAQTAIETCSDWLQDNLQLWAQSGPNLHDVPMMMEMFPAASWRYIWYGMQQEKLALPMDNAANAAQLAMQVEAERCFKQVANQTRHLLQSLPTHREWLKQLALR